VLKLFEREEITVAIVRGDHPWSEVRHLLCEEPLCLVSSRPLELDELPDLPRIGYGSDPSLLEVLDRWWSEHYSRPPRTGIVVDSVKACRRMVSHGLGYAILPAIGLDQFEQQRPVHRRALSWSDGDPVLRRTWLLCRESSLDLPSVSAFVEHVVEATAPGARCAGG
jgi:DNA-binding transcriptional LysR family regulator